MQTFETEMLAEEKNFAGLARINRELIGKVEGPDSAQRVVLDMDSTEIQSGLTRRLFGAMLRRIAALQVGTG